MVGTMAEIDDSVKKKVPELRFKGFTDDWEERKLGEVGNTFTGLSGKTKEDFGHGEGKFITYMNVFSNPVADLDGLESVEIDNKQFQVKAGDVLFTTSSETPEEVGMSSMWLGNADNIYLNSFCFGYRPTIEFDKYYLAFMLRSAPIRKKFQLLAQGISRYNISKNKVMEMSIPVPSIEEQELLGAFFNNLNQTIALHQRKLDLLKEQKKGYLQKMFPKNGAKVPELRFAGFADDWEERKLSSGLREYTDRVIVEDDKEYYQISVRNNFGGITLRGSKIGNKIGRKRQAKINLTKYPQTLIFTRQTVEQGGIGWVDKYCDGAIVTENMPTISLDTSVFSKYFLTNLFQTRIFYKNAILDNIEGGSAQIAIHESKFLSSILLFPNLDEQEKIGQFFKQLDNTIALHQRKIDLLKEQKKGFLQKMFV